MIPMLFIFRDSPGGIDNSPFSDGIGTVPQTIIGLTNYFRIFDEPYGIHGKYYLDIFALLLTFYINSYAVSLFRTTCDFTSSIYRRRQC